LIGMGESGCTPRRGRGRDAERGGQCGCAHRGCGAAQRRVLRGARLSRGCRRASRTRELPRWRCGSGRCGVLRHDERSPPSGDRRCRGSLWSRSGRNA
jgi:hypothetical protein